MNRPALTAIVRMVLRSGLPQERKRQVLAAVLAVAGVQNTPANILALNLGRPVPTPSPADAAEKGDAS